MWKIRIALALAAVDAVLLLWRVGEQSYGWFTASLVWQ
jgi:hypothetical protein